MKALYNTLLLGCIVLCGVELAMAHPVDEEGTDPAVETKQYPYPALNLDDPQMFQTRKSFWHHRRELEAKINKYHQCFGKVQLLASQMGYPDNFFDSWFQQQTLDYSAIIPASPCLNGLDGGIPETTQLEHCEQHLDAAIFTSNQMDGILYGCDLTVLFLRGIVGR